MLTAINSFFFPLLFLFKSHKFIVNIFTKEKSLITTNYSLKKNIYIPLNIKLLSFLLEKLDFVVVILN